MNVKKTANVTIVYDYVYSAYVNYSLCLCAMHECLHGVTNNMNDCIMIAI